MRTARFTSKLVNNIEANYSTPTSIEELLSAETVKTLGNHVKEGTGAYIDVFEKDMAVARTTVAMVADGDGRPFYTLDIIVAKFDGSDKTLILDLLKQAFAGKLAVLQNNGGTLHNPLPEVKL